MKDANFVEILPFDEAEILDDEPSLPRFGFRVVGLSKSRNAVMLGLPPDASRAMRIIERPPHMVQVRLLACDPRAGAKYPAVKGAEETKHYLNVFQAFVKKRTGDFDEWKASEPGG